MATRLSQNIADYIKKEYRAVRKGEIYLTKDGRIEIWTQSHNTMQDHHILAKKPAERRSPRRIVSPRSRATGEGLWDASRIGTNATRRRTTTRRTSPRYPAAGTKFFFLTFNENKAKFELDFDHFHNRKDDIAKFKSGNFYTSKVLATHAMNLKNRN